MNHSAFSSYDWSIAASVAALFLSRISLLLNNDIMEIITAVSAVILCLTAIVKFLDLVIEKLPKWSEKIRKIRKPKG